MEKILIFSAREALSIAKHYLAEIHLSAEVIMDGTQPKYQLAHFYRSPDYRNKIGGVCFVFQYKCVVKEKPEMFCICVKCSSAKPKYRVRSSAVADCSLEEIMPGDNFSSLGGRYHYDGEKIIPLKLTPNVAP